MSQDAKFDFITATDISAIQLQRTVSHDYRSGTATGIGKIMENATTTIGFSTSLANGSLLTTQTRVTNVHQNTNFLMPEFVFHIASVAPANILPGGSTVDETAWRVYPRMQLKPYDTLTDNLRFESVLEVDLYNVAAGTQTVFVFQRWRAINNQGVGNV